MERARTQTRLTRRRLKASAGHNADEYTREEAILRLGCLRGVESKASYSALERIERGIMAQASGCIGVLQL